MSSIGSEEVAASLRRVEPASTGVAARPRLPGRPSWDPARGLIARKRLTERLLVSRPYPICLVVAPAGYGKTTVLSEWRNVDGRPFCWLALEPRHNDPALLARSIAAALDTIEPIDPGLFEATRASKRGLSDAALSRLMAVVSSRSEPFVLVLDDVHLLEAEDALALVAELAGSMPQGSQIAIAAREEPPIGVGRLRGQGQLLELGRSDLAMTRSEIAEVLAGRGLELNDGQVGSLAERTEGWPVGVYLAATRLAEEADPATAVRVLAGDDRLIADYIRDGLLATAADEDREFLTGCSILDQLSGDLCDAILECRGSAERLRRLSRSNLLLVPLDHTDRDYRYHHLFREMLRAELDRGGGEVAAGLHLRAASWYAAREDFDRAIPHAIDSGDVEVIGALIWAAAPGYLSHGREATLARFLAELSESEVAGSATLSLARAGLALHRAEGPEISRWADAARRAARSLPSRQREGVETSAVLFRGAGANPGAVAETRAAARNARLALDPEGPWWLTACLIEGWTAYLGGDSSQARELLEKVVGPSSLRVPAVRSLGLSQLVLLAIGEEDKQEALDLADRAANVVRRYGLEETPTQEVAMATDALVNAMRGRVERARASAAQAEALIERSPGISAWYETETRLVLARALLVLDDVPSARLHLEDAGSRLQAIPDAPILGRMYEETAEAAETSAVGERWPLTPAELRLLHMLPTHLSFKAIAERLYVSINTVKSQARSIYRKLGVTSRAEAVTAARGAGLVSSDSGDPDPARREDQRAPTGSG